MVKRDYYLNKLRQMRDRQIIKVVTGVRRCGKSTLLQQFQDELKADGVNPAQIISINFEDIANEDLCDYHALHQYVVNRMDTDKMTYVFLDEIQIVPDFQRAVDSLFIKDGVDVYITGSNAHILSGELATLLSGRYIEIKMLPLSFAEYFKWVGGNRRDAWQTYFTNGGFPFVTNIDDEAIRLDYLEGIYNSVLVKDIMARKRITDLPLLERIVRFMFDNVGNPVSAKKIADTLTSAGRKTTSGTVESYVSALEESFILYKAIRYDVKGKMHLKTLGKYYMVDVGLRRLVTGHKRTDVGHILENIVYLELLRRGYTVSIGKIGDLEIDFIAETSDDRRYYQVSATILDEQTAEREFAPLRRIDDFYPRYVITMDELPLGVDGITHINIVDFLLEAAPHA